MLAIAPNALRGALVLALLAAPGNRTGLFSLPLALPANLAPSR